MSDALSDDGSDMNQDDSQEDVMTPAELIAKLEEVSLFLTQFCDSVAKCCQPGVTRQHTLPLELIPPCASCRQAWLNEKFSPELLENKSEVVECVMEQLTHMVNSVGITSCSLSYVLRNLSLFCLHF